MKKVKINSELWYIGLTMETKPRKVYVFVKKNALKRLKVWERRVANGIAKEIVNSIHAQSHERTFVYESTDGNCS